MMNGSDGELSLPIPHPTVLLVSLSPLYSKLDCSALSGSSLTSALLAASAASLASAAAGVQLDGTHWPMGAAPPPAQSCGQVRRAAHRSRRRRWQMRGRCRRPSARCARRPGRNCVSLARLSAAADAHRWTTAAPACSFAAAAATTAPQSRAVGDGAAMTHLC